MEETEITVTVTRMTLNTVQDCFTLLEWTRSQPGVGCTVSAKVDSEIYCQIDGTSVPTAIARLGDTVIWDGTRFIVQPGAVNMPEGVE